MALIAHNLHTFWLTYEGIVERIEPDHAIAYVTDCPFGLLNPVARFRASNGDADAAIDRLLAAAAARGVDQWWWNTPGDEPADLGARLGAAGLAEHPPQPGMTRSLEGWSPPPAPDGLEIEPVTETGWHDYLHVFFAAFGLPEIHRQDVVDMYEAVSRHPSIHNFVGRLDGQAVGCATLVLDDAGTAGVWNVGTLEAARGRGVGTAMTAAPMRAGAALGATNAMLVATPMGLPVYEAMGFEQQCEIGLWSRL